MGVEWFVVTGIEFLIGAVMTLLLWALARRGSPLPVLRDGFRRMLFRAEYRGPFLLVLGILVLDMIEANIDDRLTAALGYDLTGWIHSLEGDWGAWLQKIQWLPAVYVITFFYVVMFPVLIVATAVFAAAVDRLPVYRALLTGLVLNFLVCLPFYVFFPVKEMWAGNPENVRLLIDQLSPAIMEAYRTTSALDNCFPSFHTSLSLTIGIIALRALPQPFATAVASTAVIIVFSTLYLGIHWAIDIAAGAALAWFAARTALRWHPPGPGASGRTSVS